MGSLIVFWKIKLRNNVAALFIFLAFLVYTTYAWLCYGSLKGITVGMVSSLACAMIANGLWIWLSKITASADKLLFYAFCWDAIVVLAGIGVPLLFFASKPFKIVIAGIICMVTGIVLVKIGS